MMPAPWEREVIFQRRLREESGLTPYGEVSRWRRRYYAALVVIAVLASVIVAMLPAR